MVADRPALTRGEAAAELNLSAARISQLLTVNDLTGPAKGARNGPRVWQESLETYKEDHPLVGTRRRKKSEKDAELTQRVSALEAIVGGSERAARAAAHEMKVELDNMREQLRTAQERKTKAERVSAELLKVLVNLDVDLSNLQDGVEGDQTLLRGYSNGLTQLLAPDSPRDLEPPT